MSSSTIAPEAPTTAEPGVPEGSTLFDLVEGPAHATPDSGIIPNAQAEELLDMAASSFIQASISTTPDTASVTMAGKSPTPSNRGVSVSPSSHAWFPGSAGGPRSGAG